VTIKGQVGNSAFNTIDVSELLLKVIQLSLKLLRSALDVDRRETGSLSPCLQRSGRRKG
jgi:hypothetical protein